MTERTNEISFVMGLIEKLCIESKIALIAKERKGVMYVAIKDATDGKEYALIKDKNSRK